VGVRSAAELEVTTIELRLFPLPLGFLGVAALLLVVVVLVGHTTSVILSIFDFGWQIGTIRASNK
jgi:hypothetical protein